ncbi:unnamed protein product [Prunus brigantina]
MLGLRYALGLGRACDLQDSKRSVRPRAPVWYRLKAFRCLSKYGFSKVELQINRQYAVSSDYLHFGIVVLFYRPWEVRCINAPFGFSRRTVANPRLINSGDSEEEFTLHLREKQELC